MQSYCNPGLTNIKTNWFLTFCHHIVHNWIPSKGCGNRQDGRQPIIGISQTSILLLMLFKHSFPFGVLQTNFWHNYAQSVKSLCIKKDFLNCSGAMLRNLGQMKTCSTGSRYLLKRSEWLWCALKRERLIVTEESSLNDFGRKGSS